MIIKTPHGEIETPNMAFVATHGKIKLLNEKEHKLANLDLIISNTFHLWVNDKVKEIKKAGGIQKWSGIKKPFMTDSGGFQVFSLGWGRTHGTNKFKNKNAKVKIKENLVIINDSGVIFRYDGREYELTPEKSIKIQNDIGADIIFTFDECTSPHHNYLYNKQSLKRTHDWAERSISSHKNKKQMLFGIVQGGIYENLRKKSSKFIGSLNFDGFGIGGSFGEKQMGKVVEWALSGLPEEKPKHLLGIGKIKDIFTAVEKGIDLFDCVIPTREARHGILYTKQGKISIKKDKKLGNIFKEDKFKAQRLAIIHNIKFYSVFFRKIREVIYTKRGWDKLKKEYEKFL